MNRLLMLVIGDVLFSIMALHSGTLLRFGTFEPIDQAYLLRLSVFVAVTIAVSYLLELYHVERNLANREIFLRVFLGLIGSFVVLTTAYYLIHVPMFFRGMFLASLSTFGVFQFLWHASFSSIINSPSFVRRVIVLGTGSLAKKIGDLIATTNHSHVLGGYVNPSGETVQVPSESIVGNGEGLLATLKEEKAHKLVVSLSERRGIFPLQDVMNCKFSGIEVTDAPTFYEEITGKLLIENTTPSWFIFSNGFKMTHSRRMFKRIVDIVSSIIGLAITLPFLPLVAVLIKVDSRGPVFLRQVRVGEMEKNFVLFKFRTMREDAEKGTGAVWAQKNDPRITRVGRFLRKSRIDELPQLFNVLKGDMSFVGPRPERPEFINELKKQIPYYSERHFVKPGVTGWAQIRHPYGASVEDALEKLRYDLYYIKNISFFLDTQILFETVKVMLFGRGAR